MPAASLARMRAPSSCFGACGCGWRSAARIPSGGSGVRSPRKRKATPSRLRPPAPIVLDRLVPSQTGPPHVSTGSLWPQDYRFN